MRALIRIVPLLLLPSLAGCGLLKAAEFSWLCRQARATLDRCGDDVVRCRTEFAATVRSAGWARRSQDFLRNMELADPASRAELARTLGREMTPTAGECLELYRLFTPAATMTTPGN